MENYTAPGGDPKVVLMPTSEDLAAKLKEAGILGQTDQQDRFFLKYAQQVGGRELVASGLNLAWELLCYDELKQYDPITRTVMKMTLDSEFDETMDTMVPDTEVAADAKKERAEMLAAVKRAREQK